MKNLKKILGVAIFFIALFLSIKAGASFISGEQMEGKKFIFQKCRYWFERLEKNITQDINSKIKSESSFDDFPQYYYNHYGSAKTLVSQEVEYLYSKLALSENVNMIEAAKKFKFFINKPCIFRALASIYLFENFLCKGSSKDLIDIKYKDLFSFMSFSILEEICENNKNYIPNDWRDFTLQFKLLKYDLIIIVSKLTGIRKNEICSVIFPQNQILLKNLR